MSEQTEPTIEPTPAPPPPSRALTRWMYVPWTYTFAIRICLVAAWLLNPYSRGLNTYLRWSLATVGALLWVASALCVQLIALEVADVAWRSRVVVPHLLTPRAAFWLQLLGAVTCGLTSLYAAVRLWRATVSLLTVIGPERSVQLSRLWAPAMFFPEWVLQREMVTIDEALTGISA